MGVDEAGRGPLAGPVAVAAVCWTLNVKHSMLDKFWKVRDSKHLSSQQRERVFAQMREYKKQGRLDYAISLVGERLIDEQGIVRAVKIGIGRTLRRLNLRADKSLILLDGALVAPRRFSHQQTIIRGDERIPLIALASIAAKVWRDQRMIRLAKHYPHYGFEKHKGYGTKAHYRALKKFGPSPIHRRTFLKKENRCRG